MRLTNVQYTLGRASYNRRQDFFNEFQRTRKQTTHGYHKRRMLFVTRAGQSAFLPTRRLLTAFPIPFHLCFDDEDIFAHESEDVPAGKRYASFIVLNVLLIVSIEVRFQKKPNPPSM
jgi:hypothetical protein